MNNEKCCENPKESVVATDEEVLVSRCANCGHVKIFEGGEITTVT